VKSPDVETETSPGSSASSDHMHRGERRNRSFDLNSYLADLGSVLRAQWASRCDIQIETAQDKAVARLDRPCLDAAIRDLLEDVWRAASAPQRLLLATRKTGRRVWVVITEAERDWLAPLSDGIPSGIAGPAAEDAGGPHVARLRKEAHAQLYWRDDEPGNHMAALALPLTLSLGSGVPAASEGAAAAIAARQTAKRKHRSIPPRERRT